MKVCLVEPYYGGSHRTLMDMLRNRYKNSEMFTMRAKKWHWRLRSSALTFSQQIPVDAKYDVLFVSSMVNLADLLVLRADLKSVPNIIVYFHENQLEYPKQDGDAVTKQDRDHYFVHANIMSCLVATQVLFNSRFNMESFLTKIPAFLNHLPMEQSCRPEHERVCNEIRAKSKVVFMLIESVVFKKPEETSRQVLRIGFPHRWEHDKDPAMFLRVLKRLQDKHMRFTLRVFGGEEYADVSIRKDIESVLGASTAQEDYLEHCGRLTNRDDYLKSLAECDVVVSTAQHEFFGVSMVEASLLGCLVLCPNRLAYPELFHRDALYNTEAQLFKALQSLCLGKKAQQHQQLLPGVEARVNINAEGGQEFDQCFFHPSSESNKLQRLE